MIASLSKRDGIKYRIHVGGTYGKTTVARYTSAILRDAGLRTFCKTAGSSERVILPDGQDATISRPGFSRLAAQLRVIRSFASRQAEAVVMESASKHPGYRQRLESKILNSQIIVLTNIRVGYHESAGDKLNNIVKKLTQLVPANATLITTERRPRMLALLRAECRRKAATLIQAPIGQVKKRHMDSLGKTAHKENVAIGLAIAKLFSVPTGQAVAAMAQVTPTTSAASPKQTVPVYSPRQRIRSGLHKILVNIDAATERARV